MPREPVPALWTSAKVSQGYVADFKPFSFVDGEGVRCSLYVSGCLFQCEGCYNKAAWSFRYGEEYSQALEDQIMRDLAHESVQGLSLLGGEPFVNTGVCLSVVNRLRQEFGNSKDVWCWSGYTFEELLTDDADKRDLLALVDVLIDGPFLQAERDLTLPFRGSANQRVLDVPASLAQNAPVPWASKR